MLEVGQSNGLYKSNSKGSSTQTKGIYPIPSIETQDTHMVVPCTLRVGVAGRS